LTPGGTAEPVTLAIRVKPGSSRTRVGGSYAGPLGDALVVAVTARPVDGAATVATLVAVAEALGIRPRQIRLGSGHTSRDKLLIVDEPPPDFTVRVEKLRSS